MAFGQGGIIGPKGVIGPSGVISPGAAAAGTTFTFSQISSISGNSGCPNTGTTCSITVTSTCNTCVGVLWASSNQASTFITSVSGAGTWAEPAASQLYYAGATMSISAAYNLNETSGVTSLTLTFGATLTTRPEIFFVEYSWTGTTPTFGSCKAQSNGGGSGNTNPIPGEALTISANSVIVQTTAYGGSTPTSISGGSPAYGHFQTATPINNMSIADSENTSSGTAPNWNYGGNSFGATGACAIQ
jgi:hypothetical protein